MIDHYDWAGGREAMLRFGPDDGPVIVAVLPLLEEANRTRTFVVTLLRMLADKGVASVLPDLPGHGESLTPIAELTIARLTEALAAVGATLHRQGRPTIGMGVRSGALLDRGGLHQGRWCLSPVTGDDVLRDLRRVWSSGRAGARTLGAMMAGDRGRIIIAGTELSPGFMSSLAGAELLDGRDPRRVVRLASDPRPADRVVAGTPLWRRAEPGNDPALAALLADDIADWMKTCAA